MRPEIEGCPRLNIARAYGEPLSFIGTNRATSWRVLSAELLESEDRSNAPRTDYPICEEPAFSERAVDVLRDILEANGELLPVSCPQGDYWLYNVTRLLQALDYDNSDVYYFDNSRRVMSIDRYAFNDEAIGEIPIFKLADWPTVFPLVTESFVDRVRKHSLLGFDFKLLT